MKTRKINNYINDVKSQLFCNATEDYKNNNITYLYSNEVVESNKDYFETCLKNGLSAYKALLFFNDYLNGDMTFSSLSNVKPKIK